MILNRKNIMFSIPCYLGINGGTVSERVEICQISQYKSFNITISFNWVYRFILKSNPEEQPVLVKRSREKRKFNNSNQ